MDHSTTTIPNLTLNPKALSGKKMLDGSQYDDNPKPNPTPKALSGKKMLDGSQYDDNKALGIEPGRKGATSTVLRLVTK
jgi:hypothetical protein